MIAQRVRRVSLLGLLAIVLSTGSVAAIEPPPGGEPDSRITDGTAQIMLDSARAKWKKAHIRNYQWRIALSCSCPTEIRKPRTIKVRGSVPIKPPMHLKSVASVGRMFGVIQAAIKDGVASIAVTYGTYGVPRAVAIDVSRQIADEESSYKIDRFHRAL